MSIKPLFITFEGVDGSGKGTQLEKLISVIKDDNNDIFGNKYTTIWVSREPTKLTIPGTQISLGIRKGGVSGEDASKLFIEDRVLHTHNYIIPRLLEGSFVLVDRYDISTYAYQMSQGIDFDLLFDMHKYSSKHGAIIPDITIIFNIPIDISMNRINKRNGTHEQFEVHSFQEKVQYNEREAIKLLLEKQPDRKFIYVNANQPVSDVTNEMIVKIKELKLN